MIILPSKSCPRGERHLIFYAHIVGDLCLAEQCGQAVREGEVRNA